MSSAGAERAQRRIEALFGAHAVLVARTIHVAAVWRETPASRRFIDVAGGSPKSETDRFVLDFARSRADVVLTTGAILRAEPEVTHVIHSSSLRAWRRDFLGKTGTPPSAVLTSGRGVDPKHPLFTSSEGSMLLVPESAELPAALERFAVRVHDIGPERAVALLRERFQTVCLEIGPGVTAVLYGRPGLVDELLLSSYLESDLAAEFRGGPFPTPDVVRRALPYRTASREVREESGRWGFERLLREP